MNSELRRKP
ncbi:hypothetical protein VCHC42A1_1216, partial [Vibrio cholerae HC-42A1]